MAAKQIKPRLGQFLISSTEIRNRFFNYFKSKNHVHIKSSSVQPYADSTLEFVNAGMNQFKNVFLGLSSAPVNRAVNSQKCIRVGGKHNDLNMVGHDSYHHTFFEMLGNWSFGDYFKREACEYALELITSAPYSLPLERLYFTYFHGDKTLNLPPDLETMEIWQNLGIKKERILGFGLKENFWEMGSIGPCGPCTEIHYDHISPEPRSHLVNKDLPDLTELWNIVFMQFSRHEDGSLTELSETYVDTGMGLERLVAILQGKTSNYDTDLFHPLFETIQQCCNTSSYKGRYHKDDFDLIDTNYRILADHSRMIAVALSDYMLPDYSHSLRRVIRKSLLVADSLCNKSGLALLLEVVKSASESLQPQFPQINLNMKQIEIILTDEAKLFAEVRSETEKEWNKLREKDNSLDLLVDCQSFGLIEAYKYLKKNTTNNLVELDTDVALTCYDRYGLNFSLIEQLSYIKGYSVNRNSFEKALIKLKEMNKSLLSDTVKIQKTAKNLSHIKPTDDKNKFSYKRDFETAIYTFSSFQTETVKCWLDDTLLEEGQNIKNGSNVSLILKSTNFHSPMKCDNGLGIIKLSGKLNQNVVLNVKEVQKFHGWIIHNGILTSPSLKCDDMLCYERWDADCYVNEQSYISFMQNTLAAILLDFVLRSNYNVSMTYLNCDPSNFTAKFNIYSQPFGVNDALLCEEKVKKLIDDKMDVTRQTLSAESLLSNSNIPSPPYLDTSLPAYQFLCNLGSDTLNSVVSFPVVLNSGDISNIYLTRFHLSKRNRECTISGSAGLDVTKRIFNPAQDLIHSLQKIIPNKDNVNILVKDVKSKISNNLIPLSLHKKLKETMDNLKLSSKRMKIR